jgi:FMN-binding domain
MKSAYLNRRQILRTTGAITLSSMLGSQAFAAAFMEIEQAQKLLMADADSFKTIEVLLDPSKLDVITSQSETRIPKNFAPRIWQAMNGNKALGWVLFDRVIGKYDWIDYTVGFSLEGVVTGIEVIAYRESHGSEVRQPAWRKQFSGRKGPQSMRFADDIRNISGATLSCQHLTEGVQRLSALVGLLKPSR